MALVDVIPSIVSGIAGLTTPPTRLPDDWLETHRLAAGSTGYQLRVEQIAEDEQVDSEARRQVGRIVVRVVHRLADPSDPGAYTEAEMLGHQKELFSPGWWRGLDATIQSTSAPREEDRLTVDPPIVAYAVRVELHVNR